MGEAMENNPGPKDVFTELESEIEMKIPALLKIILSINEINDRVTLSKIDDDVRSLIKKSCEDADNIQWISEKWRREMDSSLPNLEKDPKDHEKYLEKPSKFLDLPGTKMRLDALIHHCTKYPFTLKKLGKKRQAADGTMTSNKKKPEAEKKESSSGGANSTDLNRYVPNILRTVKNTIDKLNVVQEDRDNLLAPNVTVFSVGDTVNAHLVCIACPTGQFSSPLKLTVYKKPRSNTWIISNYTRHIERSHLKKEKEKPTESVTKYFSEKNSGEGVGGKESESEELLSDEEEHVRRENFANQKE